MSSAKVSRKSTLSSKERKHRLTKSGKKRDEYFTVEMTAEHGRLSSLNDRFNDLGQNSSYSNQQQTLTEPN